MEDLCLAFGDHAVLKGVSLDLHRGETLSVLGGSGAGKSTILRLILGLLLPDSGEVRVEGHDISNVPLTQVLALRRNMGMVFQEAALFDSLSVYDNVGFYLHEHTNLAEDEIGRRVRDSLDLVDLEPDQVMTLLPAELSGGMKKRVGIARAIVHRPRLLLYDEPTSGLDPITTRTINDLILKLQTELDVSSIVVTHDIRSAFHISNRVALLFEGVLVFVGGPEEMVASEDEYVREFLR
ncbi:MAG: ATP-binding cassette domain-containing protein [Gemmatimonadetes bacterium]|nr:ATP-binding cassette domain-containing protein [Gemmatimonadota bacterium]MBT8477908.1 ATP-binding cassette domain-containing protein [Gemmatimonadota bacterium]NNK49919.1 ATP-binding cassette domain-containing protein [Gemmatimonadota bacterium]